MATKLEGGGGKPGQLKKELFAAWPTPCFGIIFAFNILLLLLSGNIIVFLQRIAKVEKGGGGYENYPLPPTPLYTIDILILSYISMLYTPDCIGKMSMFQYVFVQRIEEDFIMYPSCKESNIFL